MSHFWRNVFLTPYFLDNCRWLQVVHKTGHSVESYGAEQLFMVKTSVGLSEHCMSCAGYFPIYDKMACFKI
jgi:hypothetical protein